MTTERTYVQALRTLQKVYLLPLRTVADLPTGKGQIFTHQDLDAIFVNIDLIIRVNESFLRELETELAARDGQWSAVQFGEIIKRAAKQLKGCYTRYVNNFDTAQEHLAKLKESDKEKNRYLDVCKTHPDANGLDVRSFLIQPVQRVPRYRMLLEDLLNHTEESHADEEHLREALQRVCEVAMHINEEKRVLDNYEQMRLLMQKFAGGTILEKELVSYERRLIKQGTMSKIRMTKRQQRHVFLCNDVLLYAAAPVGGGQKGLSLKGKIWLHDGAHVNLLPSTAHCPHGFALVARDGKGYTWLADSESEQHEWYSAIASAIDEVSGRKVRATSMEASSILAQLAATKLSVRVLGERLEAVRMGCVLTKYNQRDGKCSQRWVKLVGHKVMWGDAKSRSCNSDLDASKATALVHGAKGSAFYKQGQGGKVHEDWQCFSVVTRERTLDLACERLEDLFDWYLALASLMPHSTEALMDEAALRQRIEQMV